MAKKVLLVDDEPDFLKLMGARIRGWGHEVVNAANGREAIELVKDNKIDVIVLDYMLPDMDGIDTLKNMRKIDNHVAVIMFTAYPNKNTIKDAEGLGIRAFIPKLSAYADTQASLKAAIDMVK